MTWNETYPRATVADLCRLHGVTPRALRHYEAEGLIAPMRDGRNRRSYDVQVRADVRVIVELRRAGIALSDVRTFLELGDAACDAAAAQAFLQDKLADRRAGLQEALAAVERAAQALGTGPQGAPGPAPFHRPVRVAASR